MTTPATRAYSVDNCTVGRTIAILGERSTLLVIREVLTGIRRFEDMRVRTAIPRQVLADRLRLLVEHGILRKEPYQPQGSGPATSTARPIRASRSTRSWSRWRSGATAISPIPRAHPCSSSTATAEARST